MVASADLDTIPKIGYAAACREQEEAYRGLAAEKPNEPSGLSPTFDARVWRRR